MVAMRRMGWGGARLACHAVVTTLLALARVAAADTRPNVLLIAIDDLRPALGCYGDRLAKTPHIDRLAAGGRRFEAAYCQQAVCGPSRAALLTGRLPDNTRVWHNRHRFRDLHPHLVTLPQAFKNAGYDTRGLGKVFSGDAREDDPESWSVPAVLRAKGWRSYAGDPGKDGGKGVPTESADVDDEGYPDGKLASLAIAMLEEPRERPWFLAVGFFKPHLPFNAPKRYWDLHDPAAFGDADPTPTAGAPPCALPDHQELRGYAGMPGDERVPDATARRLRHGYYACVSYVDAQVGRLLGALERLGLADKTIVVLWGDHGYSLGEADHWCKATNFERDTRVPLVIRLPRMPQAGVPTAALVEYVDLYPTLLDLAGLEPAGTLDGHSLVPILTDPAVPGRAFAWSQFSRPWKPQDPEVTGYSLRGATHRYTRWIERGTGRILAEELYDYGGLGGGLAVERTNVATDPRQADQLAQHRAALDAEFVARIDPAVAAMARPGPRGRSAGDDDE